MGIRTATIAQIECGLCKQAYLTSTLFFWDEAPEDDDDYDASGEAQADVENQARRKRWFNIADEVWACPACQANHSIGTER